MICPLPDPCLRPLSEFFRHRNIQLLLKKYPTAVVTMMSAKEGCSGYRVIHIVVGLTQRILFLTGSLSTRERIFGIIHLSRKAAEAAEAEASFQ